MGGSTAAQISSSVVKRNGVVVAFLPLIQLWLFCCKLLVPVLQQRLQQRGSAPGPPGTSGEL